MAMGIENPSNFQTRAIAIGVITFCVVIHGVFPRTGRILFNGLGVFKVIVLFIIALSGSLVLAGFFADKKSNNLDDLFRGEPFGGGVYNYAIALLRVVYAYRGWESCNNVMGEIRDPARTVGLAGPFALSLVTILYTFCNIAYFAVVSKEDMVHSGVIVAGNFFRTLFGDSAAFRILPLLIALSNLGNILVVTYTCARINAELGKHHLLPFSDLIASIKPFGTPFVGLVIHGAVTIIVLVVPPPGQVYNFIIDLSQYPYTFVGAAVTGGLMFLRANDGSLFRSSDYVPIASDNTPVSWLSRPGVYRSPLVLAVIYLTVNFFLIVLPWLPPPDHDPSEFPYYAVPLTSVLIYVVGYLYWLYWRETTNAQKLDNEVKCGEYL
jgi:amino acid transporter